MLKIEKHCLKHRIVKQKVRCFKWCFRFQNPKVLHLIKLIMPHSGFPWIPSEVMICLCAHQRLFMWQFWPKLWLVWFVWLWLAFNFGPWFFFVIDVIGVIDVISVIDVIGVIDVIDVIQLSQNMIWRTQFYGFLYFLSSLVFFCCATSENFHLLKL